MTDEENFLPDDEDFLPDDEDDPALVIHADEAYLSLVREAPKYADNLFILDVTDEDGNRYEIHLDAIQAGDIIADARDAGLPVEWPYPDGMPNQEAKHWLLGRLGDVR